MYYVSLVMGEVKIEMNSVNIPKCDRYGTFLSVDYNSGHGLYTSPLFDYIRDYLIKNDSGNDTTFLFVPYIKANVVKNLLDGIRNRIVIVTTWEPTDLLSGSSDLSLYTLCQRCGYAMYVSHNLHLKIYSVGLKEAILSTSNVSHRGLYGGGNHEAAVLVKLTAPNRLFLETIRQNARLADDGMYKALKEWTKNNKQNPYELTKLADIIDESKTDLFLTSALPMTRQIDDLVAGYMEVSAGHMPSSDPEIASCVFHDIANYEIKMGLGKKEFLSELQVSFFTHPFIKQIDKFISPEAYFGKITSWIQSRCTDVPIPSRRKLVGNVQVLLEWFVTLGNGKYIVDIPYSHSQRIRKVSGGSRN